jgi:hypothetical protein
VRAAIVGQSVGRVVAIKVRGWTIIGLDGDGAEGNEQVAGERYDRNHGEIPAAVNSIYDFRNTRVVTDPKEAQRNLSNGLQD